MNVVIENAICRFIMQSYKTITFVEISIQFHHQHFSLYYMTVFWYLRNKCLEVILVNLFMLRWGDLSLSFLRNFATIFLLLYDIMLATKETTGVKLHWKEKLKSTPLNLNRPSLVVYDIGLLIKKNCWYDHFNIF